MTVPVADQTPTQVVLAALQSAGCDIKRISGQWAAQCPSHDDRMPSLTVKEGREGQALVHCHAGCHTQDVVDAVGLRMTDLFPDSDRATVPAIPWKGYLAALKELDAPKVAGERSAKPLPDQWERVKVEHYDYAAGDGSPFARVVRFNLIDKETGEVVGKTFVQQRWNGHTYVSGMQGAKLPLYRLPKVLAAVADGQPVWVVEGEKDVHTAEALGHVATTSPGGAGSWRPEHTEALAGATVAVVVDQDNAGHNHAAKVSDALTQAGSRVLLFAPAEGKDLTDHVDAGHGIGDLVPILDVLQVDEPVEAERTSWWPKDLGGVLSGDDPEPQPEFLRRLDDVALMYRGKVNGLIGESESGKTWVALLAALQALQGNHDVAYLDFEDTAPGIVSRLRSMGATDADLGHLYYIGPDEALHQNAYDDLMEFIADQQPPVIVLDGFNAAMTLLGLELTDNTDATKFAQLLLKPLAASGACVIYVDHVPKSKENRGKGGIGAQAKRAMTTGCALSVEVVSAFGRGIDGQLRLTVDKDRPGHVRAASANAKGAGLVSLTNGANGAITVEIERSSTDEEIQDAQRVQIRRQIMDVVGKNEGGLYRSDIAAALKKKLSTLKPDIDWLRDKGQLVEVKGVGNQQPRLEVNPDPDQIRWDLT